MAAAVREGRRQDSIPRVVRAVGRPDVANRRPDSTTPGRPVGPGNSPPPAAPPHLFHAIRWGHPTCPGTLGPTFRLTRMAARSRHFEPEQGRLAGTLVSMTGAVDAATWRAIPFRAGALGRRCLGSDSGIGPDSTITARSLRLRRGSDATTALAGRRSEHRGRTYDPGGGWHPGAGDTSSPAPDHDGDLGGHRVRAGCSIRFPRRGWAGSAGGHHDLDPARCRDAVS